MKNRYLLPLAMIGALALPTTAQAVGTPVIVTGPGAYVTGYTHPVAVASPGDEITYVNADIQPHDVVAVQFGPDTASYCDDDVDPFTAGVQRRFEIGQCPIFWSALITVGKTTPVLGLENISGGGTIYDFFCSIHGNMKGKLVGV
jgi:plastocyanin